MGPSILKSSYKIQHEDTKLRDEGGPKLTLRNREIRLLCWRRKLNKHSYLFYMLDRAHIRYGAAWPTIRRSHLIGDHSATITVL